MYIYVPKEKFPSKDDIGYKADDAEISHDWNTEGDFWVYLVEPMPDHPKNIQLSIGGQIVGGTVYVA